MCNLQNTNLQHTSRLQRQLLANLLLLLTKKRKKERINKIQNIFASIYQEFQVNFLKLRHLQNISWPRPNQLGLTWNLKLTLFEIKLIFEQKSRKKYHKKGTICFYCGIFWYFSSALHRMRLIGPSHSSQFMEHHNSGTTTLKHAICAPNVF